MIEPTNGTKRMSPARMPQSTALGTPMSQSPVADENAEPCVEDSLHQEKTAQSCGRVVERCCAALQVGSPCQPKEPIADILALQQDEHQEEYGERGGRQRRQQRSDDVGDGFKALRLGLTHLYHEWLLTLRWRWRRPRLGDFILQIFQRAGSPLQRARGQVPRRPAFVSWHADWSRTWEALRRAAPPEERWSSRARL